MASRLTNIAHQKGSTPLSTVAYTLNSVGNRTSKTQDGVAENYSYDAVDQVTGVVKGSNTQTFAYDAVGNRQQSTKNQEQRTYSTNPLNQYTTVDAEVMLYDTRGNLTTQGLTATFGYDSKNRLTGATKGADSMSFAYDYRNRQASRTVNGTTTYFIYDGWDLIAEYGGTRQLWQKYIHGAGVDEILAKIDGAGTVYYHQDGLGSTVALTNATGDVVERYTYDVFGLPTLLNASNTVISATAFSNRFLFTGREWLRRVGLYDYRNRVYSPDLGRFLQSDPIRFDAGDVNLYRYVGNGVVNETDPMGLEVVGCRVRLDFDHDHYPVTGRHWHYQYQHRRPSDGKLFWGPWRFGGGF